VRKVSKASPDAEVPRFDINFRIQHILMFISVTILVITAMPLWCSRYPFSDWPAGVIDLCGGLEAVRAVHHGAGFLLIFAFAYHLLYVLMHPAGRQDFLLMLPRKKDFADLYQNLRYFLGKSENPPRFGRFSYFEKFDYWAVFWGCLIMMGTGVIMLYPQAAAAFLPQSVTNRVFGMAREAHYHEAILAALALFTWHVFNVHFKPGKFPGSMVWWHGKITREEQEREHPLEPEEILSISPKKKDGQ
jgi:cytochrome b subunit of formate dehydrogenase